MVRVAVADPLPLYRAGVAAEMRACGHTVEAPEDLASWAGGGQAAVLLLTLASDRDWALLAEVGARASSVVVVALVIEEAAGVRAVRAGARSVLPRDTTPAALRRAVDAAADGMATLPAAVLRKLRTGAVSSGPPPAVTPDELSWLRHLAAGATVSDLADRAGYSERAMYRLLKTLYTRLGTANRTQALMRAQALGWLTGN